MADVKRILARDEAIQGEKLQWEPSWRRATDLLMPRNDSYNGNRSASSKGPTHIDGSSTLALTRNATVLEVMTTPRERVWHRVNSGDAKLDGNQEAQRYFEEYNKLLWEHRYKPSSNFASQAMECYMSLGAIGNACMLVTPRDGGGIDYRAIHMSEIGGTLDSGGGFETIHRRYTLGAHQAFSIFGDGTPDKIMKAISRNDYTARFEFLHSVEPDKDLDFGARYAGTYIFLDGKEVVKEEVYHEQPYIVFRYFVGAGETYGRGPGTMHAPDIAMLQNMAKTVIMSAELNVQPALFAHQDIPPVDVKAGEVIAGALDDNGRSMIEPWTGGGNPVLGADFMSGVRDVIDDGFLGAYFRVLIENPNMTATQATLLAQQQGQMVAPIVGRLQSEFLDRLLRRESGILWRQGLHPVMPDVVKQHIEDKREPLRIEYESPIQRAALADDLLGIMRGFESLAPMAAIDPTVYSRVDMGQAAAMVLRAAGFPAESIKSADDAQQEIAAAQEQQAIQNAMQLAPIAADTAKKLADAQAVSGAVPGADALL